MEKNIRVQSIKLNYHNLMQSKESDIDVDENKIDMCSMKWIQ